MGIISDIIRGRRGTIHVDDEGAAFAVDSQAIPAGFFGLASYAAPVEYAPRIERRSAMQCGAVQRTRNLICILGTLPLVNLDAERQEVASTLVEQPERNVPRSVTMVRTVEDMLFEGIAWWRIVERDYRQFPTKVRRLKPGRVQVDDERGVVYVDGQEVDDADLIRFDSPNDPLLVAGARAIRACLTLDAAAARYSDGTPPMDYFLPRENGVDPFEDDDEAKEFLTTWAGYRRERTTAYVPYDLTYETADWDPAKLQLAEARAAAVLDIARHGGIDPEELGVSTTSRTYRNDFDRRKSFTDFTIGLYRQAIEDRLSMNDVTPRGQRAVFDLDAFLRSDPLTRMQAYEIGKRTGAYTTPEIRDAEGKPALSATDEAALKPAPTPTAPPALTVVRDQGDTDLSAGHDRPYLTFDGEPALTFSLPEDGTTVAVDFERRTITGRVAPYGVIGVDSQGRRWVFSQGTIKSGDPKAVKMWIRHNPDDVRGYGLTFDDRTDGLYASFKVEDGPAGDEALRKADPNGSATWDAFSVGLRAGGKYRVVDGVNYLIEAPLMEVSLTPAPVFEGARVHHVAASATSTTLTQGVRMPLTAADRARLAALRAKTDLTAEEVAERDALAARETAEQTSYSATFDTGLPDAIAAAVTAAFDARAGQAGPERVAATERIEVTEASPYRFDGGRAEHSFSMDMRAASMGDTAAMQRIETFVDEAFAVTVGNAGALNPTQNRPELYVPNLTFSRPLWDLVTQGTVDDATPFTIPKFASATGLVGNHVQGVEPTPGAFTATNQTVTPAPMSGKIEINREVLDQGGSPQADQIIWGEMINAWYEAIEAKIAALLNALGVAEQNLGSATGSALVTTVENIFIDLQYARGGNRFSAFAADGMLFKALAGAVDSAGRPLLPITGPTNSDGGLSGAFDRISLGNQTVRAAWALGSAINSNSFVFVPGSVFCWASQPKRFDFQYQVKSVDMAIWGYCGAAVTRDSDVKRLDYTSADA